MPYYYDLNRPLATNATSATESLHMWVHTAASQETASIIGLYAAAMFATAGGAQLRVKDNTGTSASGGTSAALPNPKNRRGNVAAQTLLKSTSASSASTDLAAGATLLTRLTVGFAQTGGMGGYVPIVPSAAIQLMPNSTNPVDIELSSIATSPSVAVDITFEFAEGV